MLKKLLKQSHSVRSSLLQL